MQFHEASADPMELGSELGWTQNGEGMGETGELTSEAGDLVAADFEFDSTGGPMLTPVPSRPRMIPT